MTSLFQQHRLLSFTPHMSMLGSGASISIHQILAHNPGPLSHVTVGDTTHLLLPVGCLGTLLASIQRLVSQYGTSLGMAAVLQRQVVFISSAVVVQNVSISQRPRCKSTYS